jgi:polysaccharide biosynthesis/export protein
MRWHLRRFGIFAAMAVVVGLGAAHAAKVAVTPKESLVIGPGDLLQVSVLRESELTQKVRVLDSGEIVLPLIGRIHVGGDSTPKADAVIEKAYVAGQFLKKPQVTVTILQFATQTIAVLGEVRRPGTVTITTPRSLLDVLAMAGGLKKDADRHITIERGGVWGEQIHVFLPNNPQADFKADVSVHPGDRILVPKAGIVYVLGDVGRPGGYVMQDNSHLTVLQAVALAAGANKTAAQKHARLLRKGKNGYTEEPIQLRAMERGKIPDMQLKADDVLYVPFSARRNLLLGGPGILASASSALIYAHP